MSNNLASKCPIMVQILVQADYWTFTGMTLLFSQYLEISFCKSSCNHKNSYTRCVSNFLDGWEGSNYYLQKTGNDTKVRFLVVFSTENLFVIFSEIGPKCYVLSVLPLVSAISRNNEQVCFSGDLVKCGF